MKIEDVKRVNMLIGERSTHIEHRKELDVRLRKLDEDFSSMKEPMMRLSFGDKYGTLSWFEPFNSVPADVDFIKSTLHKFIGILDDRIEAIDHDLAELGVEA